jgi:hypothetical protein
MAAIPAAAAATASTFTVGTVASFAAQVSISYLIGRLAAQDGPRLDNKAAAGGDYGIPMARAYGSAVRVTGAFIAQANIRETTHKVEDHSEIAGAIGGAATGFMIGGPVGAVIGGVAGALLGFAAPDQKYYTYSDTFALFLLDRTNADPITGVLKMWANGKLIFNSSVTSVVSESLDGDGKLIRRKYGKNKYFKSLTIYGGHTDQTLDPILASKVAETGAYPFSALAVFEDLQLAPFGNSVPPIEGLVSVIPGETMADAAEAIALAAGIDPLRDLSTTALIGDALQGYLIAGESSCWDALKPLLPVFGVDAAEVSGQIRFYRRSQSMRATIPPEEMGAHYYGDTPPPKYLFARNSDLDLPRETSLTFIDPTRDYQTNTMTSRRTEGNAASNVTVSIPVVMSASEGASVAALMHWDAWLGRTGVSFTLTDAWNGLAVGVAYALTIADEIVPYRIKRRVRGVNGIIEVEAVSDETVTYTAAEEGTSGTIPEEEDTEFPDTRLILMDMPILEDAHDDYGHYVVMGASAGGWTRGRVDVSTDGVNFVSIIDQPFDAIMGDVTGTLAEGTTTGLDDTLDTTTVLTVVLLNELMELESVTDDQLDLFANFAYVGKDGLGEYLQFKTATHISGSTWELTDLRRGRKGTDHAIGTHTSGEEFALLGGAGVFRIVYSDTSVWGDTQTFRGVTLHQDEADADTQTFDNTGEGKRPYSPVNVEGTWDGSNNLDITWDSRSRLNVGGLGIDDNAEWDIEITSGAGRSDTVVVESYTYTAADQITDGITPGDSIAGRVRQTSDVNDGRWRNFLLLGPDDSWELEDDLTPYHLEDGTTPLELEA